MRQVLDEAAQIAPDWLRTHTKPEWITRYGRRFDGYRLSTGKAKREELAITGCIDTSWASIDQVIVVFFLKCPELKDSKTN